MLQVISKMLGEVERSADGSRESTPEVAPRRRLKSIAENEEDETSEDDQQEEGENSFCAVPVDHPVEIPPDRKLLSHKFLLSIIFSRCRDSAASVRSKALSLLAECTHSTNRTIMLAMRQIFVNNKPRMFTTAHIPNNNINLESPRHDEEEEEGLDFPNASMVVAMLHRRALDDKVTVRKSALQVLENLMKLHTDMLSPQNLMVSSLGRLGSLRVDISMQYFIFIYLFVIFFPAEQISFYSMFLLTPTPFVSIKYTPDYWCHCITRFKVSKA